MQSMFFTTVFGWVLFILFDTVTKSSCVQVSFMTTIRIQRHLSQCFGVHGVNLNVAFGWVPVRSIPSPTFAAGRYHPSQVYVSNGHLLSVYWTVIFGCVPSRLIPSPNLAAWRYHPWPFYVSNSFHICASGCMACTRLLCLSALHCSALGCITLHSHNSSQHSWWIRSYMCEPRWLLSHRPTLHCITLRCIAVPYMAWHSQHSRHWRWM